MFFSLLVSLLSFGSGEYDSLVQDFETYIDDEYVIERLMNFEQHSLNLVQIDFEYYAHYSFCNKLKRVDESKFCSRELIPRYWKAISSCQYDVGALTEACRLGRSEINDRKVSLTLAEKKAKNNCKIVGPKLYQESCMVGVNQAMLLQAGRIKAKPTNDKSWAFSWDGVE